MTADTTPANFGPLAEREAYYGWLTAPPIDAARCVDTRAAFAAGWVAAMTEERERCARLVEDTQRQFPDGGLNGWLLAAEIRQMGNANV